jgi:hypothetical protein
MSVVGRRPEFVGLSSRATRMTRNGHSSASTSTLVDLRREARRRATTQALEHSCERFFTAPLRALSPTGLFTATIASLRFPLWQVMRYAGRSSLCWNNFVIREFKVIRGERADVPTPSNRASEESGAPSNQWRLEFRQW